MSQKENMGNKWDDLATFTKPRTRERPAFVVVSRRGNLLLNRGFMRTAQGEMAGRSHALLHYSRRNHALILEFTKDGKKPGALKISAPHFNCSIAAKSFFNEFGLAVENVAGRYEPAIDEIPGLGCCWVVYLKGGKPAE